MLRTTLSLLFAVKLGAASAAQRAPDLKLDTTNPTFAGASSLPQVSVSGSKVYVVWQDDRASGYLTDDIYFNRSLDGGLTWLPADVRLDTAPGTAYSISPVIASNGDHVFVAWTDNRDFPQSSSIYFTRSLDAGTTWSANTRLDVGLGSLSAHPRLSHSGDTLHVVWFEATGPTSIQYATSSSAGDPGTWSLPVSVSGIVNATNPPAIACSADKIYVAWQGTLAGSPNNIYFNRAVTGAGGSGFFATPILLDTQPPLVPSGHSGSPAIASAGDEVFIVWDDGRNGPLGTFNRDIYFQRSLDGGVTFLPTDVRLDTGSAPGTASSWRPVIALSTGTSPTQAYVAWHDTRNGYTDIWFNRSSDAGSTWLGTDVRVDDVNAPGSSNSTPPQIAASGTSVAILWKEETASPYGSPYFTMSEDGGLNFELRNVRMNTGPSASIDTRNPAIAAVDPTAFHVVWEDLRLPAGNQWDIRTNRFDRCLTVTNAPPGGVASLPLSIPLDGGLPYFGAASLAYTPGLSHSTRTIPLVVDPLLLFSTSPSGASIFVAFAGILGPGGTASPTIAIPAAPISGFEFYVAFVTLDGSAPDGIRTVTRAVKVTIL